MNKITHKLKLEAGLVPCGNSEYIGTHEQWQKADDLVSDFHNHDCHLSPEDGCNCQKYYERD